MKTIYTLEEIKGLRDVSEAMREQLLAYFEEIDKGIVVHTILRMLDQYLFDKIDD